LIVIALALTAGSASDVKAAPALNPSLNVSPEAGPVGTEIGIAGQGFPPSSDLDLHWGTVEGRWVVDGHSFLGSEFTLRDYVIASIKSDISGSFETRIRAPYDFGGRHFITVLARGSSTELAKGIFTLLPSFSISPAEGPPGTAITIRASGLGWGLYTTNWHVLWDNKYVGYATAVTTRGNATFTIYAVGDPGRHYIDIYEGYPGPAYLNIQEGPPNPVYYSPPLVPFHSEFTITPPAGAASYKVGDVLALGSLGLILTTLVMAPFAQRRDTHRESRRGIMRALVTVAAMTLSGLALFSAYSATFAVQAQPKSVEIRPEIILVDDTVRTPLNSSLPTLAVNPRVATVGSPVTISGSGFRPGASLELLWTTKKGSYLTGWTDVVQPLGAVEVDSGGSFTFNMKAPHDLEGLHEIGVSGKDTVDVRNTSLYITRSASITPTRGPSGTTVGVKMTGVGWTFVTNTATVVYDNAFVGYACGFYTRGNVTLYVKAVGKPGIHTIDIYPTIYDGPPQGKSNAEYRYPLLTPEDHPVRSPAFHFEFLITESDQSETLRPIFTPQNVSITTLAMGLLSLAIQAKQWAPSRRPT